ncbi:uncharacterized protein LOC131432743 [Malaya genurostris]|uniref:uncharacterized protein LOC131432743 n=1 Tax=Malaya genurostris TaxID=325434 RepID=UPI0026F3A08E|nr:uncharacterized protein LOC131432743 [Malaya genurostris]
MSYVAKCALCNKFLPYNRSDTSILVRHMSENHPEQQYTVIHSKKQLIRRENSSSRESSVEKYRFNNNNMAKQSLDREHPKESAIIRELRTSVGQKADENLPDKSDFLARRSTGRNMLYKTTVASWRPARARLICQRCGQSRYPTIRSSANRYAKSTYGAVCIMSCWPFCFLPCLFTAPTKHHLHCSSCGAYLGVYDPSREVIDANRQHRRKWSLPDDNDDVGERKLCARC